MGGDRGDDRQSGGAPQMVTLPEGGWRDRPGLPRLVGVLGGGSQTRAVGGAVRDALLGIPHSDVDLATRLLPGEVIARLETADIRAVPTGLDHGTVTAITEGGPVEVTTLRRDVETDGRRAVVAFTDEWEADAARRDFTINALYADSTTGEMFDYFGGRADLAAGLVRFIGAPLERIAEDHLRILRLFRFHARFGRGDLDPAAYDAAKARANDLMALSRERIAAEWLKLLAAPRAADAVKAMLDGGVLKPVLPEIQPDADAALARLMAREESAGVAPEPIRRFAALIAPDPDLAHRLAVRLKLSKVQARRLALAAGWHEDFAAGPRAEAYRLGSEAAIDRALLRDADLTVVAGLQTWQPPRLPITGGAIIAMGVRAGPDVSQMISRIESAWVAAGFPEGAALDAIVARFVAMR